MSSIILASLALVVGFVLFVYGTLGSLSPYVRRLWAIAALLGGIVLMTLGAFSFS